jgi:hypothetical protein
MNREAAIPLFYAVLLGAAHILSKDTAVLMHNAQTWERVEIKLHNFLITTLDAVSS